MARAVAEAIEAKPDLGQIPPIKARDMGVPTLNRHQEKRSECFGPIQTSTARIAAQPSPQDLAVGRISGTTA